MLQTPLQQWATLKSRLDLPRYHQILIDGDIIAAGRTSHDAQRQRLAVVLRTASGDSCMVLCHEIAVQIVRIIDQETKNEALIHLATTSKSKLPEGLAEFACTIGSLTHEQRASALDQALPPERGFELIRKMIETSIRPAYIETKTGASAEDYLTLMSAAHTFAALVLPFRSKRPIRIYPTAQPHVDPVHLINHINAWHDPHGSSPFTNSVNDIVQPRSSLFLHGPEVGRPSAHDILEARERCMPIIERFYEEARANPRIAAEERKARDQLQLS